MVEPTTPVEPRGRPRGRAGIVLVLIVVAAVVAIAAWAATRPASPAPGPAPGLGARLGLEPLIAMVDGDGALITVDRAGRQTVLGAGTGTTFGFPAWSPDGTRVAAIRSGAGGDAAISVFAVSRADPAASPLPASAPVDVYRSADVPPFYLYWAPDGRRVSFLATEGDGISLRIAPADGTGTLDGSDPGSVIRRGEPLYFDWIASDRLLLHVGAGDDSFVGEVGLDGSAVGPVLPGTGEFRSAVAGADGRFMAYVQGQAPGAKLVVAARDGSGEHALPVVGPAAAVFGPSGSVVAALAAEQPTAAALAFPVGPLRLIDAATGAVRTLIDGTVVGFFWSPDGQTVAVLRLQAGSGSTTAWPPRPARNGIDLAAAVTGAASPSAVPTPLADPDLHVLFVHVADGAIRSDHVVQLGRTFVNQLLPYFDQYALSHRLWAPDSSSLLLPIVDGTGEDRLAILPVDGAAEPATLPGRSGFWSP